MNNLKRIISAFVAGWVVLSSLLFPLSAMADSSVFVPPFKRTTDDGYGFSAVLPRTITDIICSQGSRCAKIWLDDLDATTATIGTLTLSGSTTGAMTIDITDTEALLVRKDADAGDVFTVDTSGSNILYKAAVKAYGSTSGILTFATPATVTSYTLTWPSAQASGTKVLSNDGSGNLSWTTDDVGANTALSNLAAVAINTDLLPGVDNTPILGSASFQWGDLYLGAGGTIRWNDATATGASVISHGIANTGLSVGTRNGPNANSNGSGIAFTFTLDEAGSGDHPLLQGMRIVAPTINAGLATITDTATLYITAAPTATVSGRNKAFWVDAGVSEFGGNVTPDTSDGAALGTTSLMWSDLFLASGGVLDFNANGSTITHSAPGGINTITLASTNAFISLGDAQGMAMEIREGTNSYVGISTSNGTEQVYFGNTTTNPDFVFNGTGEFRPNVNDGTALGISGTAWSDLFLADGGVINFVAGDTTITHSSTNTSLALNGTPSPAAAANGAVLDVTGTITEAGSGDHALLAGLSVTAPTITGGLATVTNTAALYVSGPMSTTVSGGNYSLYIADGNQRIVNAASGDSLDLKYNTGTGEMDVQANGANLNLTSGGGQDLVLTGTRGVWAGISMRSNDDNPVYFGTSELYSILFETADVDANYLSIVTGSSNNIIISADNNIDWTHATSTNPTLWIQSADQTQVGDNLQLWHDQTNGQIASGNGNLVLTAGSGGANIVSIAGDLDPSSGSKRLGLTTGWGGLTFDGTEARTENMGRATTGSGNTLTISSGGAQSGATDANGGNLIFASGIATGNGSSSISFQTVAGGQGAGTADRNPATIANLANTGFAPNANDGIGLGTTSLGWSDLYLASGAVINFAQGDVVATHSANTLTFTGATNGYSFDETIVPDADDGAALGATSLAFSDLFLANGGVVNFNNDVTITHAANTLTFGGASSGYKFDSHVLPTAGTAWDLGNTTLMWANLYLGANAIIDYNNGDVVIRHSTANSLTVEGTPFGSVGGSAYIVDIGTTSSITENSSGNHPRLMALSLTVPSIITGVATVSDTAMFYVAGAMNAIVSGANYASWIDDGLSRFDGALDINEDNTSYTTNVGIIDLDRQGALTGVDTQTIVDARIGPTYTLTEPASGSVNYYGANIDLSSLAVTAGTGTSVVAALNLVPSTDADIGTSLALRVASGTSAFGGAITPLSDDGSAIGSASLQWADLFLASGGTINFAGTGTQFYHNGSTALIAKVSNVTVATFNGAGTTTFGGAILPPSNDGAAIGAASTGEWSDLFLASGGVLNFGNGKGTITNTSSVYPLVIATIATATVDQANYGTAFDATVTEAASGNHSQLNGVTIKQMSVTEGGATVTDTANLYVDTAPTATVSGKNYSLRVNGAVDFIALTTATGTPGSLCQNGTEVTKNAASTCAVSARDQKNSIEPLNISALETLAKLNPVTFQYNDVKRDRIGFIADELQAVDSRLADGYDANGNARSIDVPALIALNVKAEQELAAKAESADEKIKELVKKVDALTKEVKALKAKKK